MSKRDTLIVYIKWFYRTNEVPEQVYQLLIQDRHTEHKTFNKNLALAEKAANEANNSVNSGSSEPVKKLKRSKLDDRMLRMRELFVSEATDVYPVSVLRGKCSVYHCQDIKAVKEFIPNENTFFFTLSYNPETRRLASTQGEIRVGASHQVRDFTTLAPASLQQPPSFHRPIYQSSPLTCRSRIGPTLTRSSPGNRAASTIMICSCTCVLGDQWQLSQPCAMVNRPRMALSLLVVTGSPSTRFSTCTKPAMTPERHFR